MKTLQILAVSAFVAGLVGVSSAQTVIRLTGSTAFRAQTNTAILRVLGSTDGATLPAGSSFGFNGGNRTSANFSTFVGTFQGNPVIVQTSFSGSNGGILVTAGNVAIKYHQISGAGDVRPSLTAAGTSNLPNLSSSPSSGADAVPDIAMMDTLQSATPFRGTYRGRTYANLTATRVGVIPYQWIVSKNAPARMTNITERIAQAQWIGIGYLPLAVYTGNSTDRTSLVYATGRNDESGTRNAAFTEARIGATTTVQQFDPNTGALYPATTDIGGFPVEEGNGGESSGGTVVTKVSAVAANAPNIYVSYVSINDAGPAITAGNIRALNWNGVGYTPENVIDGSYTFWTYQNLGVRQSYTGVGRNFANALAAQITNETSPILLSAMRVSREVDGGVITPTYQY